ncbi:MAG: hypothetical protein HY343_02895, partial [Lentisphaerae bacterium]|nr:hypothetical protein [Lentisphaerota bacterium]
PTSWNARIAMAAIEHMWGDGAKFIASKSEWGARIFRWMHTQTNDYDLADPVYEPGQKVPDKKTLLQTHLGRNILPAKPWPADETTPAFTDVGDGHELFAIRRGQYYGLVYAGKRTPFWMDLGLGGQNNFSGGGLTALYLRPNRNLVILGRARKEYGWPPAKWESLSVPVVAGELQNGRRFNTGICRNRVEWDAAKWTIRTTGEAVGAPVNFERRYVFNEANIAASVKIREAFLDGDVSIYRHVFHNEQPEDVVIKQAWELIPIRYAAGTKVSLFGAGNAVLGELTTAPKDGVQMVEINTGSGGVRVQLEKPQTVKLSGEDEHDKSCRSVQIRMADMLPQGQAAELNYQLVPF